MLLPRLQLRGQLRLQMEQLLSEEQKARRLRSPILPHAQVREDLVHLDKARRVQYANQLLLELQ